MNTLFFKGLNRDFKSNGTVNSLKCFEISLLYLGRVYFIERNDKIVFLKSIVVDC